MSIIEFFPFNMFPVSESGLDTLKWVFILIKINQILLHFHFFWSGWMLKQTKKANLFISEKAVGDKQEFYFLSL